MRRNQHPYTLVELLDVIGITALLISILLPALTKARDQAMTEKSENNLRQLMKKAIDVTSARLSQNPDKTHIFRLIQLLQHPLQERVLKWSYL
jgi:type II secretory pathway pseudopilin PulG